MSDFTIFSHLCCLAMVLNIYHASHGYNSDTQLHGGNYHPILKNLLSIQTNSLLTKIRHFVKFQDTGCDVHTDIAHTKQKVNTIVGLTALRLAFFMIYE